MAELWVGGSARPFELPFGGLAVQCFVVYVLSVL